MNDHSNHRNFQQWLDCIQQQHPQDIELGLERISQVAESLKIATTNAKIVLIGGTNGKGSTLAILEAIALANNQQVFSYSSPHIFKFNERIRINGKMVSDDFLISAFEKIEKARGEIALTFFEFTTLAAMVIQSESDASIALYEVGLGGRLDAVNILQPELSIITSIALDHTDWLGETLEQIAFEKMAIGRKHEPLLLADASLPEKLVKIAQQNSDDCLLMGKDFNCISDNGESTLSFVDQQIQIELAENIHANNLAAASFAAHLLGLKVNQKIIQTSLNALFLPARFERVFNKPVVILDVSHNQQAIAVLQQRITSLETPVRLVCGMLADKLLSDVLQPLTGNNYHWYLSSLDNERGATAEQIKQLLINEANIECFKNVKIAMESAFDDAQGCGSIVVFGSFVTIELAGKFLAAKSVEKHS